MMRRLKAKGAARRGAAPSRLGGAAAFLFLLAGVCAHARGPAARPAEPSRLFQVAKAVGGAARPDAFEFELSGYDYRIANNGAGRRVKGGRTRLFNLRLEGADWIERLYYAGHGGNVLLACEVSDGESGAGFVVRLEQPSMRALWRAEVPAFNLGPPLRDGGHLYLTGIGFVAKLELETGRFVWRRAGLSGRAGEGTFNVFALPELSGDAVLFREAKTYDPAKALTDDNRPAKTLRVHRKTGKILGIE